MNYDSFYALANRIRVFLGNKMKLSFFDVYRDRDYLGQCVALDDYEAVALFYNERGRYHVRHRGFWLLSLANND
jgi:hypothetical protein